MATGQTSDTACHNCRRRRLKCDRTLPTCLKCAKTKQECLGYQRLFRWEQGVASRGKMAGKTFEGQASCQVGQTASSPGAQSLAGHTSHLTTAEADNTLSPTYLADPLIQSMDGASWKYLSYFARDVCKDFVLYDTPRHNHFRDLIPLTQQYPVLLQIMIAVSALHMSNSYRRSSESSSSDPLQHHGLKATEHPRQKASTVQNPAAHNDAVTAKQQALHLLKSNLINMTSVNMDAVLAVVLLFIQFDLIDSGHDSWIHHINGARTIIKTWCGPDLSTEYAITPLRSSLISEYLVFDILGSAFTDPVGHSPSDIFSTGTLSLLQDAEGNHCSSFPAVLLQLLRDGARLSHRIASSSLQDDSPGGQEQQDMLLLHTAQSFNPIVWAANLKTHSPATDLLYRARIAAAHRAAVCIYLSRVLISVYPSLHISHDLEPLVAEVVAHLSVIPMSHELFKAIAWPSFIAGAETDKRANQEWIVAKLQNLWEIEPWGFIRGAVGVLDKIWEERRNIDPSSEKNGKGDWIRELRGKGVDWLIL